MYFYFLEKALKLLSAHRINDKQKIQYKSIDLSINYDTVANGLSKLEEEIGPIYMLVNCAGMALCGTIEDMSIEDSKLMMDINYYATYYPTRYILPKLKATGNGIIVITSSQAALIGVYGYGPYAAAKFALRGLAETIAMEISHTNVTITLALPADTDTPGFANENKTKPLITKIISGSGGIAKPEDVGRKILNDALVIIKKCSIQICAYFKIKIYLRKFPSFYFSYVHRMVIFFQSMDLKAG